jgi:hypothetical protein
MLNGEFSSMTNFFMPTNMALSSSAVMAYGADFILAFLLIRRTILKSKGYPCYWRLQVANTTVV